VKKIVLWLFWVGVSTNLLVILPAAAQTPSSPESMQAATELASIMSKDLLAQMTSQMTAQVWPQSKPRRAAAWTRRPLLSYALNSNASFLIL